MAKKPAPTLADGTYVAADNIVHNGEAYAPGEALEDLTEAEAASLLACGALTVVPGIVEPPAAT